VQRNRQPRRDIATTFSKVLGRGVTIEAIPREKWEALFKAQGMADPTPRMRMLDGFNEGWIEFEGGETGSLKGTVPLETVLIELRGSAQIARYSRQIPQVDRQLLPPALEGEARVIEFWRTHEALRVVRGAHALLGYSE
jgi:hypothetical protein